jgi:hypothetical protein
LNFDPVTASAEMARLWDRSHTLLWALAIGSFAGFIVLAAIALTGSPAFVEANKTASPWLLLASILFAALAALKHYQERTIQTVKLFPDEGHSLYHGPITQTDGSLTTQIDIRFEVFNISDKSIWLPNLKLLRPKSRAPVLTKAVALKDQSSRLHGCYELPPGARTPGSVHLMIQEDLTNQIAHGGVKLWIEDQFGHRHKLNLPSLRKS